MTEIDTEKITECVRLRLAYVAATRGVRALPPVRMSAKNNWLGTEGTAAKAWLDAEDALTADEYIEYQKQYKRAKLVSETIRTTTEQE